MNQAEEREVVGRGLKAMLDIAAKNAKGLPLFAQQKAEELGVEFLGAFDERPEATVLQFYHPIDRRFSEHGEDWAEALDGMGQLRGVLRSRPRAVVRHPGRERGRAAQDERHRPVSAHPGVRASGARVSLAVERSRLLGAFRGRVKAQVITGGLPSFSGLEALEAASREAVEDFMGSGTMGILRGWTQEALAGKLTWEDVGAYAGLTEHVIRQLFLRSVVTLNVASKLDPEEAEAINTTVDKVMAVLSTVKPPPGLKLVE